jgi:two-component system sensor histidine kinase CpxA
MKKLRAATRRLSSGNFDVRVAQAIGRRNDEISELGWDFDRMADRIQTLIASKQGLLDDVSHEFRSPLARLQVAVGLARHKAPNALIPEVERIEREINRLDDLVGQVLMLSRFEANAIDGCHDYVDLPALLEDIVQDAEFEASSKNRHIQIIQNLNECTFKANVSLLYSALENVIRNAVKYTHDGTTVDVSLDIDMQQADWVQIKVCDCGNGVPNAMLPKLFDPFFRVENARERETGGHGLGLSIAQRAIQVHGGEIQAKNRNKGGLCIVISLPIR